MRPGLLTLALGLSPACLYSNSNREGLDLSCLELGGGNACRDGIITSCQLGAVEYQVCDDERACSASWQKPGRFRCEESDGLPPLILAGSGGSHGASGASASAGSTAGADSANETGATGGSSQGAVGGTTGGTQPSACAAAPCMLVDAGDPLASLAADSANLYFQSAGAIAVLSKAGGSAVSLARVDCAFGGFQLAVNSNAVYVSCNAGSITRVLKGDGASETVVAADAPRSIAAGDGLVAWSERQGLGRYVPWGTADRLDLGGRPGRVLILDGFVYWAMPAGISRVAAGGDRTQSLQLAGQPKDFALADGNAVALFEDRIIRHSLVDNTDTTLAEFSDGRALAVRDSTVFWTDSDSLNAMPLDGGVAIELASATEANDAPGSLIVDPDAIYWVGGSKVYRLDRSRHLTRRPELAGRRLAE